jgi:GH18 family chitinase
VLQESSINTLLFKGANQSKLVLGLPLYGRIFRLKNIEGNAGYQKDSEGPGIQGPYVQETGFWGYNEVSCCSCDGISERETLCRGMIVMLQ